MKSFALLLGALMAVAAAGAAVMASALAEVAPVQRPALRGAHSAPVLERIDPTAFAFARAAGPAAAQEERT